MSTLPLERLLAVARERCGWDRPTLTAQLGATKQQLTNWRQRGVPPRAWPSIARKLGITVEALLSDQRTKTKREPDTVLTVTRGELEEMEPAARDLVMQLISAIKRALRGAGGGSDAISKS
jgi:hypothetical protein